MSALTRLLLIPAALLLWSTPGPAKEIKGAPKALMGYYGENRDACRSYHRKGGEEITVVGKDEDGGGDYYGICGGSSRHCIADVLTHRQIPSGFSLKLRYNWKSGPRTYKTLLVTRVQDNLYKFDVQGDEPQTLMRCSLDDALAGIGLPDNTNPPHWSDKTHPYYYVLAVPNFCPELEVATELFPSGIYWQKFNREWEIPGLAARNDHRDIRTFCKDVLGAFGENGRVIPNLLRPSAIPLKVVKGTPEVLRGVFAEKSELCSRWSLKGQRVKIGADTVETCNWGWSSCRTKIVSHIVKPDGFFLNIGRSYGEELKIVDKNTIFFQAINPTTLHRCPF